jgi:RHS repeat-associated protein
MRVTSETVGTDTTTVAYYPTGLTQQVTFPDGAYLAYTYDNAHRLTQVQDGAGNKYIYTLNTMGQPTNESAKETSGTLDRTVNRTFDTLNRMSAVIGAADSSAVTTSLSYDADSNVASIAAPLSRTTAETYDSLNRLATQTNPTSGETQYQYTALDQVAQVTDPRGLPTTYQHNGLGDLLQLTSPDTGTATYSYDSGGNLASVVDARNATANYVYDELERPVSAAFSLNGTTDQTITYTYDQGTNGLGRLTGASDANHSMGWSYDGEGRVVSKTQTVGGIPLTNTYAFTNGNETQLTTPSGQVIVYSYSNHQVSGITVNGTSLLSSVNYEAFGPVRGWTWGGGAAETRLYNTDGNPSQFGGAEYNSYTYDNAFRITTAHDSSNSALSWTYGYDTDDRLTGAATSAQSLGWAFDANGNRLSQSGATSSTLSYSSSSNQPESVIGALSRTYQYDAVGNTLSTGADQFTYNDRGRMASSTAASVTTDYLYNVLGQRIEKSNSNGTTMFAYDEAGHLLGEYTAAGALIEETVWLGDIPVATIQPGASGGVSIYYIHSDYLNTPRIITQATGGAVVWRWDTDPFGAASANTNPGGLGVFGYNLRLPGQYADAETGLNYNYFRDYDPQTGRYAKPDPIGLRGGINTFAYTADDPIGGSDPYGLWVYAVGFGGSSSFYIQAAGSFQIAISGQGWRLPNQIGYLGSVTPASGFSTGIGGAIGFVGSYSSTNCISDLKGWSSTVGGSVGAGVVGGIDVGNLEDTPKLYTGFIGLGLKVSPEIAAAPGEVHAAASVTSANSISIPNISQIISKMRSLL